MPDNVISHALNTDLYLRRRFFEELAAEALSPEQIAAGAELLGMAGPAMSYAVAVFTTPPEPKQTEDYFSVLADVREKLMTHFLKYSEYVAFPWGPAAYAAVIYTDAARMAALTDRCVNAVRTAYTDDASIPWHVAVTAAAQGLDSLPALLREASRLWALRYSLPEQRVFLGPSASPTDSVQTYGQLLKLDPHMADPSVVRAFLERGWAEEIPAFAEWYAQTALGGAESRPLRHYGIVSSLMAAKQYAISLGLSDGAASEAFADLEPADWSGADLEGLLAELLGRALSLRTDRIGSPEHGSFSLALKYINEHFTMPDLSLDAAAQAADMNPAYLSALFRRRTGQTFTDSVTQRRVELARHLLLSTDRRPAQIAEAVGYRDRHYFSVVFKKLQGCTPTQFRAKNRR